MSFFFGNVYLFNDFESVLDGGGRTEQILGEELPALAKEVARVEMVRAYAGQCFCCFL